MKRSTRAGFLLLLCLAGLAHAAIPETERQALIDLYNSTNGPGWTDRAGWLGAPGTECSWSGVSCDSGQTTVVRLQRGRANLVGTLPASLANLTNLGTLAARENQLSGTIPPEVGSLTRLTILVLADNQFRGGLPDLSRCTGLQILHLNDNTGFDAGSLPDWLSGLTELRELNLSFTNRTGNLPDMSGARKLQILDLGGNTQMGPGPIPAWLAGLTTLVGVELFNTNRTGDLPDLSAAVGLQLFDVSDNPGMSAGPIPAWIAARPGLIDLGLGNTNRTGSIPDLGSSTNLQNLNLGPNPSLSPGPIPAWVANLRALTSLSFWNTNRTGEIPNLSALTSLETLVLKDNPGLNPGPIPSWIAQMPRLGVVLLGGTSRNGPVPDLSRLSLAAFDVGDNPALLAGPVPEWLVRQPGLFLLLLGNSNRQGTVPDGIGGLTGLMSLDLSSNQFTGEVPASLRNLTKLGQNDNPYLLIPPELLYLDLRWNALHTADSTLASFLDSKQRGGDWRGTQTVAPENVAARPEGATSVRISWTPVAYRADPGFYEVFTSGPGGFTSAGKTQDKSASSLLLTGLTPGSTVSTHVKTVTSPHAANPATVTSDASAVVTATAACPTLTAPSITSLPGTPVAAGASFTVAWVPVVASYPGGTYRVDISTSENCAEPVRVVTAQPALTIATEPDQARTYCFQVAAIASEGCESPVSPPARVAVEVAPAFFTVLAAAAPVTVRKNDPVPTNLSVILRNAGGSPAALVLTGLPGLFSPVPASVPSVQPGQDVTIQIQFDGAASTETGLKSGNLAAAWSGGSLATPVLLNVVEKAPEESEGAKLSYEGTNDIHFRYTGDGNPPPQNISIVNTGTKAVSVTPRIGPGGGWLSVSGDFSTPIPAGGSRMFTLSVDRKKRVEADGTPPLVTNLVFLNLGGRDSDSAYGQVFDEEPPPAAPGNARPALGENDFSLILGSAVSAQGRGARFVSEAWIENRGSSEATADLYYTPEGVDGLLGDAVTKSRVTLSAHTTYRLSDFVEGLFSKAGSGQVELRSTALPQLAVRSTADAITTKQTGIARYGSEIPLVMSRQGVRTGSVSLICGLRDATTGFRTNVILAETSGKPAAVRLRLYDGDGKLIGQKPLEIAPYSKIQINSTDESFFVPGRSHEGGTIEVVSESGTGSVAAFATVIDNASGSYATRAAEVFAASGVEGIEAKAPGPLAASPLFLPAVTRSEALNNSFYTTRLVVANLGRSAARLKLTYLPDRGLGEAVTAEVTVAARAEGPKSFVRDDVLGDLFGVRQNSSGMIRFEGDLGAISVASETSTPLDLGDSGKGRSISAVNPAPGKPESESYGLYGKDACEVIGTADSGSARSVVFHPAIEEGFAFRTNLILAELAGEAVAVTVRIIRSGMSGVALGEKTFALEAFQRLQRNKIVREILGQAGDDPGVEFKDVEIEVRAISGKGRALAIVTKIDNNPASKRADIFTLGGAMGGPSSPVGTGN